MCPFPPLPVSWLVNSKFGWLENHISHLDGGYFLKSFVQVTQIPMFVELK